MVAGWAIDGTFRARTGFPINVLESEQSQGISYENIYRPDRAGSQPLWISDSSRQAAAASIAMHFKKLPTSPWAIRGRAA